MWHRVSSYVLSCHKHAFYWISDISSESVHNTASKRFSIFTTHHIQVLSEIFKSGYSRIPVYGVDKHDIVGLILTKDLIFLDPDVRTVRVKCFFLFSSHVPQGTSFIADPL